MSRLALSLSALALASGTATQAGAAPDAGKNPTADSTDDQALGCRSTAR